MTILRTDIVIDPADTDRPRASVVGDRPRVAVTMRGLTIQVVDHDRVQAEEFLMALGQACMEAASLFSPARSAEDEEWAADVVSRPVPTAAQLVARLRTAKLAARLRAAVSDGRQ
ncbi:conserved hypothetical protein [Frankia sp. Hr75.2]|nr:conserved hypothetical protein [Frankia sp. Hr75.2]